MHILRVIFSVFFCFLLIGSSCYAQDADTANLLKILHENGTLSDEQYKELTENENPEITGVPEDTSMPSIMTEGGIEIANYDGSFSFTLGGRVIIDAAFYDDKNTDMGDGTEIRNARVEFSGNVVNDWEYEFDIDFAEGDADISNAYIAYLKFWPTIIKAGQFKEPFSLERLTSGNNVTFMERSLINEFTPGRNIGFGADMNGDKWTASAGFFGQEFDDDVDDEGDEGWGIGGRATIAPVLDERHVLHFGAAGNYRKVDDEGEVKYNPQPESHITDIEFCDTDDIEGVDNITLYGLECAGVYGPFSVQGEYMKNRVNRSHGLQDYDFDGFYIYGSWFITGESRKYINSSGKFGKITPQKNMGAVEMALRYSGIDLTDHDVTGGKQKNTTVGINWYINSNIRLMANYIWVINDEDADADGDAQGNDDPKIFQTRMQLVF